LIAAAPKRQNFVFIGKLLYFYVNADASVVAHFEINGDAAHRLNKFAARFREHAFTPAYTCVVNKIGAL
jgi:hypothetical protein